MALAKLPSIEHVKKSILACAKLMNLDVTVVDDKRPYTSGAIVVTGQSILYNPYYNKSQCYDLINKLRLDVVYDGDCITVGMKRCDYECKFTPDIFDDTSEGRYQIVDDLSLTVVEFCRLLADDNWSPTEPKPESTPNEHER